MPPPSSSAFVGSLAFVRRGQNQEEQWLTVWDSVRSAYRFIEARRESPLTFRTCLIESIEDELDLDARDYLLSDYSLAHHQAPIEWPGETVPAWVVVEFFPIDPYGRAVAKKLENLDGAKWWTLPELFAGKAHDGSPFCERQHLLICRADIIPTWAQT